jgi:SAM-dependent MidA family methyltransferase
VTHRPWPDAWQDALYGPNGFYRNESGPAGHFRTGAHVPQVLGVAVAELAARAALRRVVDVGCGRGELLAAVRAADPGLELVGVDVVDRPAALPDDVGWVRSPGGSALPQGLPTRGALVVANEWLDVVPCPVLVGGRVVEVDRTGAERLGDPAQTVDLAWAHRWWPDGDRVEVGRTRDAAWSHLVSASPDSLLVAVDYAHAAGRRPPSGTLTGFRGGRQVAAVPDGSCDLTAHVALDSCAAAGRPAGALAGLLTDQRTALRALGVRADLPPAAAAAGDPLAYLASLERASWAGELLDPAGLGGFGWLVQATGGLAGALLGGRLDIGLDLGPG